jgi:hypothetical protein
MGSGSSSISQSEIANSSFIQAQSNAQSGARARQLHNLFDTAAHEEKEIALRSIPLFENIEQKSAILMASILASQKFRADHCNQGKLFRQHNCAEIWSFGCY